MSEHIVRVWKDARIYDARGFVADILLAVSPSLSGVLG
jgi:hypothetical protein